jgi:hypothetical protein
MRRHVWSQLAVVLTILALIAAPAMAQKKKSTPIKIGLLYSLSGLAAVYTQGTVIGHEIAAEEINAKGGILGRPIEFVTRDDKLKPGIAVKEFRRMVTSPAAFPAARACRAVLRPNRCRRQTAPGCSPLK